MQLLSFLLVWARDTSSLDEASGKLEAEFIGLARGCDVEVRPRGTWSGAVWIGTERPGGARRGGGLEGRRGKPEVPMRSQRKGSIGTLLNGPRALGRGQTRRQRLGGPHHVDPS